MKTDRLNMSMFAAADRAYELARAMSEKNGGRLVQGQVYPMTDGRSAIVFHSQNEVIKAYSVGASGDIARAEHK